MSHQLDNVCCFCMNNIENNDATIKYECGHIFHKICENQYNNQICPLCRQKVQIRDINIIKTDAIQYNDNQYVWIFNSFFPSTQSLRENYVIYNIKSKNLTTGYFWRLFDDAISNSLEAQYQSYLTDNSKNDINLEIGAVTYNFSFDNILLTKYFHNDISLTPCLQKNQMNRTRPVLRILWKDAIDNLLIVGIHDNKFFEKLYMYTDGVNNYLFNMDNQNKINNGQTTVVINNISYIIDGDNIRDQFYNVVYKLGVYDKNIIVNF
jgi:hypothetical protein